METSGWDFRYPNISKNLLDKNILSVTKFSYFTQMDIVAPWFFRQKEFNVRRFTKCDFSDIPRAFLYPHFIGIDEIGIDARRGGGRRKYNSYDFNVTIEAEKLKTTNNSIKWLIRIEIYGKYISISKASYVWIWWTVRVNNS